MPLVVPLGAVGVETASVTEMGTNVAVTFLLPLIVTVTGFVDPLASPLQVPKVYAEPGVAVNATCSP